MQTATIAAMPPRAPSPSRSAPRALTPAPAFDPRVIHYIAHAESAALLLDGAGVCRWFVHKRPDDPDAPRASELRRCVGAQFVATLDADAPGQLLHEPEVGKRALFARVEDGRIVVFRFGPLVDFEHVAHSEAARAVPPDDGSDPTLEMVGRALEDLFEDALEADLDLVTSIDRTAWAPDARAIRSASRAPATPRPGRRPA